MVVSRHFCDVLLDYPISLPTSHLVCWTKPAKQKLGDLDIRTPGKEKASRSKNFAE
jgi:hypothetical protein